MKARKKQLRNRRWTKDEIAQLKRDFRKSPLKALAKRLKRSEFAVANKASRLGLRRRRKRR